MTDNTEQLAQELVRRDVYQWSHDELDTYIVDAYLSLKASMKGQLFTSKGLLVEPYMDNWTKYEGGKCLACLAGTFFVSQVGTLLQVHPNAFYNDEVEYQDGTYVTVLTFLDGLRYLEEGGSIHVLLPTLGYQAPPVNHAAVGGEHLCEAEVLSRLGRFINLNRRLRERLQEHTRTTNKR